MNHYDESYEDEFYEEVRNDTRESEYSYDDEYYEDRDKFRDECYPYY